MRPLFFQVRAGMVAGVGEYAWSSYRERVLGKGQAMLDIDPVYTDLASTDQERRRRYLAFLKEGVSMSEKQFIDESVNRNQLTGNRRFVDEIEQRIGLRVERRGRGRPGNEEK